MGALAQLTGDKRVVLWPPSADEHLYVEGSSSRVGDVDCWNDEAFPCFRRAVALRQEALLDPGDQIAQQHALQLGKPGKMRWVEWLNLEGGAGALSHHIPPDPVTQFNLVLITGLDARAPEGCAGWRFLRDSA